MMRLFRASAIFGLLLALSVTAIATDLTGAWESRYQVSSINEVMTATLQQVGDNLLGSFSVESPLGPRSGIIFGAVEGDEVKANFLSVSGSNMVTITFFDGRIEDQDSLKGTYYVQRSDKNAFTGPFEAIRK
jgi:hypothetical protein